MYAIIISTINCCYHRAVIVELSSIKSSRCLQNRFHIWTTRMRMKTTGKTRKSKKCDQGFRHQSIAVLISMPPFFRSRSPPADGVIATYEEHEDSVYAVEWSSADPWVFASLSYDGRLVINRVPRTEKYKILL